MINKAIEEKIRHNLSEILKAFSVKDERVYFQFSGFHRVRDSFVPIEVFYPNMDQFFLEYEKILTGSLRELSAGDSLFPPLYAKLVATFHSDLFVDYMKSHFDSFCQHILNKDEGELGDYDVYCAELLAGKKDLVLGLCDHMKSMLDIINERLGAIKEKGGSDE